MKFSNLTGSIIITAFSILIIAITYLSSRKSKSVEHFLVGNREFGTLIGAFSSAAAWIWAPALFVSSQISYTKGLPGVFWFIVPNTLALIMFAFLAKKVREVMEKGYTLPEYIRNRLGPKNEFLYDLVIFIIQCSAVISQLLGSLLLLNFLTGISKSILVIVLAVLFFLVASFRGIRSTVVADILKIIMILSVVIVIVPIVIVRSGGISTILGGIGGANGTFTNLFDISIAWTYGIPTAISLLAGITIDQQQWQRAFSIKKEKMTKAILLSSIIFFIVPFMLSLLGFIASNPNFNVAVSDPQLSGFAAIAKFFPQVGTAIFTVMALLSLTATGSSALCACGSITIINIYKQYFNQTPTDKQIFKVSRITMLITLLIGASVALIPNISILYIQLLNGAFKATLFIPTILSLFWKKLSSKASFWSTLGGLLTGAPLFIYGSIVDNASISTIGSIIPLVISGIVCFFGSISKKNKTEEVKLF